MIRPPLVGAGYLLRGFRLIRVRAILPYVAVPVAINIAVFGLLAWAALRRLGTLVEWLTPAGYDWLEWLIWPVVALAAAVILFYAFTMLANLIAAPFNAPLAEAVERYLTGTVSPVPPGRDWRAGMAGVASALASEARKLLYYLVRAVPLLVLAWVPVLNVAAPPLWLALNAWMLALQYADYPMGNHGLSFAAQRARLRRKPLVALGFGAATLVVTLVPLLNFVVVPAAVAGATAMWVEEFSRD